MISFIPFTGVVSAISHFETRQNASETWCYNLMTVRNNQGNIVRFVITPDTYFVNQAIVRPHDYVTGYYDGNAATPLIFPPQYQALVMNKERTDQHVKASYFNRDLLSEDGQLQLNVTRQTLVVLRNGQPFSGDIRNRNLVVIYQASTKSIPAQTTPQKIIVWC